MGSAERPWLWLAFPQPPVCGLSIEVVVVRFLFGFFLLLLVSRHNSGDAAHASGWKGVRDAEATGGFGLSTTLGSPVRSGSRGFRRLRPCVSL